MKKFKGALFGVLMAISLTIVGCRGTSTNETKEQATIQIEQNDAKQTESVAKEATEKPSATNLEEEKELITITVAAAASLENTYVDQLIPLFQAKYPWITVEGTYDSSGKLQTQIEEGLNVDIFMSAATKQMDALVDKGLVDKDSVIDLVENKVVLIKTKGSDTTVTSFETILEAKNIAIGDPASVPVGQYTQEIYTNLGSWDTLAEKASLGTNVTEVLHWVGEGSAEVGIVYATDALSSDKVEVIAEAPADALEKPVIYPVGRVATTKHKEEADLFLEFLQTPEAVSVFETFGFSPIAK